MIQSRAEKVVLINLSLVCRMSSQAFQSTWALSIEPAIGGL
jgi:hypothetical protein